MKHTIFLTGFPGFIAGRLIGKLAETQTNLHFICLIQEKFNSIATDQVNKLSEIYPQLKGNIQLMIGDITQVNCGVSENDVSDLKLSVQDVWHLAAVYDLSISYDIAYQINVNGTRNVLQLCKQFSQFRRLYYISTAYVSGERTGKIYEEELSTGQVFRNHYESTKYLAEVEVKKAMKEIPTTIFRPGIVTGDSHTGETQKFDGPYYVMNMMYNFPTYFIMPMIGSGINKVNLVPVDYLISAMAFIAYKSDSENKVFHLTDPTPLKQVELINLFQSIMNKKHIILPLPKWLIKFFLKIPAMEALLGLPSVTVDYFDHPHEYDMSNTDFALKGSGVSCPKFSDYFPNLLTFFIAHLEELKQKKAMY